MKEFDALCKRKRENDNKDRLNAGIVAAAIYNSAPFGDEGREPVSPLDFVPEWKKRNNSVAPDLTEMTPEQQKNYFFNIFSKRKFR